MNGKNWNNRNGFVCVSLQDSAGNHLTKLELNAHVHVSRLIPEIVKTLKLPQIDSSGRPVVYHFTFGDQQLKNDETLSLVKVIDGSLLTIVPENEADQRKLLALEVADEIESRGLSSQTPTQWSNDGRYSYTVHPIFSKPVPESQYCCDVFMVMPFADKFQSIYSDYIKPVVESLDLVINRGDDFFSHRDIMDEIWLALVNCKFVIVDCTGRNANVFYELGIAHVIGKPTVLLTQDTNDLPFDIRGRRVISYKDQSKGLTKLKTDLTELIPRILDDLDD